jgi:hypothetical protein
MYETIHIKKRKKEKAKKTLLIIGRFILFILLLCGLVVVHELGHIITNYVLGGYYLKFEFLTGWPIYPNNLVRKIVLVSGTILALFISLLIAYLGYKLNELSIMIAGLFYYTYEFLYWALSTLVGFGDAYYLNDWQPHYIFALISFIYYFIAFIFSFLIYWNFIKIRKKGGNSYGT